MKRKTYFFGVLLLILLVVLPFALLYDVEEGSAELLLEQVRISEFMASNNSVLADEDGAYSDWIEIHNNEVAPVDLGGWYLSDDANNLTKWQFPSVSLAADGYLVVFASGKDRVAGAELHTNFKLQGSGEYLALVEPDGTTVAWEYAPQYVPQLADVSYGVDLAGNKHYFTNPTPGAANESGAGNLGPIISEAAHMPALPTEGDVMTVTATISESVASLASVSLHYRIMYGQTSSLPMLDDGTQGDGAAGDGVYGALIPLAQGGASAGDMVRYYITASDADGRASRWPLFQSATNSPEYFGTMIANPSVESQLPVLHWFVEDTAAAETREGTRASLFYDGRFYDNVFVRTRGRSAMDWPKKSFKFDFNQGDHFYFSAEQAPVEEFNLNTTYSDKAYIRQTLAWESYRDSGATYSISFPMRLEQNGQFHSVATFVEQPDERYLTRQGLDPDGALYKMYNTLDSATVGVEKRSRLEEDHSDLQALIDGLNLPAPERINYLYDNVNIPAVINYLATAIVIHDIDIGEKNYYLYRDTQGTGEWRMLPWDKDLTFGRNFVAGALLNDTIWANNDEEFGPSYPITLNWNRLVDVMIDDIENNPVMREMYLRRLRTLMDQQLQPPATPAEELHFERRIDQLYSQMESDVALDAAKWPLTWGSPQTFSETIRILKNDYLAVRRVHLYETHGPPNGGIIPDDQGTSTVNFGPIDYNPASGNQNEEYITLVNPNSYAVDISGWGISNSGDLTYTFQSGVVIPANGTLYVSPDVVAFRNRATRPAQNTGGGHFVQGNYKGELSNTSGSLELRNTQGNLMANAIYQAPISSLAGQLIVNELNYHPPDEGQTDGDELEFIELKNVGNNTLDLGGVHFTDGINYTFPISSTLAPNEMLLLVRNPNAFHSRYANHNVTIAATYPNKLSNAGENITLVDNQEAIITSFDYDDKSPWAESADGPGDTLTRKNPPGDPNDPSNWQASSNPYGSPCADEAPNNSNQCVALPSYELYLPLVTQAP